jgi:DNA-binding transcriptional ArsR family regulator
MIQRSATDQVFHAVSDPTRRSILEFLTEGPLSAGELAERLPVSLTAVGQHLRILEQADLVRTTKSGRVRTCELRREGLRPVADWVEERRTTWTRRVGPRVSHDFGED